MRDDSSFIELKARQRAQALLDEGSYRELLDPFEGIISPWLGPQGIVPQADVHDHEQRNAGRQARSRAHRGFVAADVALAAMQDAPPIDAARFRRDLDALADQDSEPRF